MKTPFEIYTEFICNALLGGNPSLVDKFYKDYEDIILEAVAIIQEKHPIKTETIYRGILLNPNECEGLTVKPLEHMSYLSFSENKEIALDFADTGSDMSSFVMQQYPDSAGFLIEYKPNLDEILFHYSWIDVLGLSMYFGQPSMNVLNEQKEVILKQRMNQFNITAV